MTNKVIDACEYEQRSGPRGRARGKERTACVRGEGASCSFNNRLRPRGRCIFFEGAECVRLHGRIPAAHASYSLLRRFMQYRYVYHAPFARSAASRPARPVHDNSDQTAATGGCEMVGGRSTHSCTRSRAQSGRMANLNMTFWTDGQSECDKLDGWPRRWQRRRIFVNNRRRVSLRRPPSERPVA